MIVGIHEKLRSDARSDFVAYINAYHDELSEALVRLVELMDKKKWEKRRGF